MEVSRENYFGEIEEKVPKKKSLILVIYDITDNKRRLKMVKILESYGVRIQKSAFEAMVTKSQLREIKSQIDNIIEQEDLVRLYVIKGISDIYSWGELKELSEEEVVFI